MSKLDQAKGIVDKYRNDPHVWGRSKQVARGLLIADGLVGMENPLDGKKSRPGIVGSLFPLAFGALFIVVGIFIVNGDVKGDTETTGQITSVNVNRGNDSTTCSLTASYTVDGTTYTASTYGSSSGNCNKSVGQDVTVEYKSIDPRVGKVHGSGDGLFWLFPIIGAFVFLAGLGTFLLRLASIVGGLVLYLSGRKQVKEHPTSNGNAEQAVAEVKQEMLALLMAARSKAGGVKSLFGGALQIGTESPAPTAAPTPYPAPTSPATTFTAPPIAPPAPVAPAVPAPGWYPTANGQHERYWDGLNWSADARPTTPQS